MPATSPVEFGLLAIDVLRDVAFPWLTADIELPYHPTGLWTFGGQDYPTYHTDPAFGGQRRVQAAVELWAAAQSRRPDSGFDDLDFSWAINHALGALPASRPIRGAALRPWVAWFSDELVDVIPADDLLEPGQPPRAPRRVAERFCSDGLLCDRQALQRVADQIMRDEHQVAYRSFEAKLESRVDEVTRPDARSADLAAELPSLNRRPGVVFLPAGDYHIDDVVSLFPGQTLRGSGPATRLRLRGPNAHLRLGRVPMDAQIWDYADRVAGAPLEPVSGRVFAASSMRAGLEPDEALYAGRTWIDTGYLGTTAVVEDLTIIDERSGEAIAVQPPALDGLNASWSRIRRVEFIGRHQGTALRLGRYSPSGDASDVGPYFNRVEACRFERFGVAIDLPNCVLLQIDACEFVIGSGGAGIRGLHGGHLSVTGNVFRRDDARESAGGTGIDLRAGSEAKRGKNGVFVVRSTPGLSEFSGNRFVGLARPIGVESSSHDLGLLLSGRANAVLPSENGTRPTLFGMSLNADGLPVSDGLAGVPGVDLVTVNNFAATPDEGPPRFHSQNRLSTPLHLAGPIYATPLAQRLAVWDGWWLDASHGLADGVFLAPVVTHEGPVGPGLEPAVHIDLQALIDGPLAHGIGRRPLRVFRLATWVVPPAIRTASTAEARIQRRRASRVLGGRPLSVSGWIRTNLAASPGIGLALYRLTNRGTELGDIARTSGHGGDGRWSLLTASATTDGRSQSLISASDEYGPGIIFAIEIRVDPSTFLAGRHHYVDVCTPFVGTGAYPQPPRARFLTEAGGVIGGCVDVRPAVEVHTTPPGDRPAGRSPMIEIGF